MVERRWRRNLPVTGKAVGRTREGIGETFDCTSSYSQKKTYHEQEINQNAKCCREPQFRSCGQCALLHEGWQHLHPHRGKQREQSSLGGADAHPYSRGQHLELLPHDARLPRQVLPERELLREHLQSLLPEGYGMYACVPDEGIGTCRCLCGCPLRRERRFPAPASPMG